MLEPELAQAVVEQHYRLPRNKGCCEEASAGGDTTNPLCGDEISLSLRIEKGTVACARFEGQGCAVSQASASLVVSWLEGQAVEEAVAGLERFLASMAGDDDQECGDLEALLVVRENPARATCATLAATLVLSLLGDGSL